MNGQDKPDQAEIKRAWDTLKRAMRDPDYAWSWQCNLAVPIMDAIRVSHERADTAAAYLMQHLWDCDITTHPYFEGKKSDAQAYTEIRIAAEQAEDAARKEASS
jgi:hypothetical protein